MTTNQFNLEDAVALLERTPASLRALLSGLPETWTRATEGDNTWSPYAVIGHLIHGDRVNWIPRARHLLSGESRPFAPFDRVPPDAEKPGLDELLKTFTELRRENVATLVGLNLTDDDLKRKGQHPELGEVTLAQLLGTWVVHDLDHVAQIARTMAKSYTEATGPWSAYLSILRDRQK
jgi:hypothetical protein